MNSKRFKAGEIYSEIVHAGNLKILTRAPFGREKDVPDHDLTMLKYRSMMQLWEARIRARRHRFKHILELGISEGGSIPYLFDLCDADFIVGIDIAKEDQTIAQTLDRSTLAGRYELYFETDQADSAALNRITDLHFPTGLDLIVDDASHLLAPTRQSFEILFPKLKPGGLYVIEDYAWGQSNGFAFMAGDAYRNQPAMIQLLFEISMLMPSQKRWITKISSDPYSVTVQKGPAEIPGDFTLEKYINNWPGLDLDRLQSLK